MLKALLIISTLSLGDPPDRVSQLNDHAQEIFAEYPDSALGLVDLSLKLNNKSDLVEQGRAYSLKGLIYQRNLCFDSSLVNHIRSLKCREAIGDPGLVGRSLINIGNVYYLINDTQNAEKYYGKGLESHLAAADPVSIAYAYNSLGNLYTSKFQLSKAKKQFFEGLEHLADFNDQSIKYDIYINLGVLYEEENQYDSALVMFRKAEEWYLESGSISDLATIYVDLGVIYQNLEKYDSAKLYYDLALDYNIQLDDWRGVKYASKGWLLNEFEKDKDTLSKNILIQFLDSEYTLDSLALKKNIQEVEAEYQVEKNTLARKMAEDQADFEKQKRRTEKKEAERNILILMFAGAFVMVLAFLIVMYYRQKNRIARYQLQEKKDEVNRVVAQQETRIYKAQLEGEGAERKRVAQELHDRVGGLLATVNLHLENVAESEEGARESVGQAQNLVHKSIEEVRSISHNLAMDIHVLGLKSTIEQFAEGINSTGKLMVKTFYAMHGYNPDLQVSRECLKIIRELVANTLKYADAKEVNIQLSKIDDTLQIIYDDDGNGFDINHVKKGLGLKNMKARAAKLGGDIDFDSAPGRGTTAVLTIPIQEP